MRAALGLVVDDDWIAFRRSKVHTHFVNDNHVLKHCNIHANAKKREQKIHPRLPNRTSYSDLQTPIFFVEKLFRRKLRWSKINFRRKKFRRKSFSTKKSVSICI